MKFERILLVNPPYEAAGVTESVSSVSVTLAVAMLAALCRRHGRDVRILDLNLYSNWQEIYQAALNDWRPDTVGITFTTPMAPLAAKLAVWAKEAGDIVVLGGGPHATALPEDTLRSGPFDAVALGEAEPCFEQALLQRCVDGISGWVSQQCATGSAGPLLDDLDSLPFAAVDLFEVERYVYPARASRQNPVCLLETSRGCYARCTFCNKNVFGFKIRRKSPQRVVDEMEYILNCGYREIHLADDLFTADMRHAEAVCREILKRGLHFPWVPRSGLRVDRVSPKLMEVMAEAGCYHIPFGIESGNQEILDRIKKGITLEQVRLAVRYAKNVGMQTTGYFMVGMPGETVRAMTDTLEFAVNLELDFVKVGVCIPLPGTPMFNELEQSGRLKTREWDLYTYATPPWDLVNSEEIQAPLFDQLKINDIPVMALANRTLVRQDTGNYILG